MSTDTDLRLRAAWHASADTLSPSMQGRLRAARRTALQGDDRRSGSSMRGWSLGWLGVPAGAVAAVAVVALLVPRMQADAPPPVPRMASQVPTEAIAATPAPAVLDDTSHDALALEDDPDFYLWLDGINTPPASEARHDPT